jgi:hypothetical protein
VAATTAIEILLRHLLATGILSARSPSAAFKELQATAAAETRSLCRLAQHARRANPKAAAEALAVAEDLARIVGEIATDVGRDAGEPIGPGQVMRQRAGG